MSTGRNFAIGVALVVVLTALTMAVGGCKSVEAAQNTSSVPAFDPRDFEPGQKTDKLGNPVQQTSLWNDHNRENWLFTDHKARCVNDIVTILITESSKAKKVAKTSLGRESDAKLGISGLLGLENALPRFVPEMNMDTMIGGSMKNDFSGSGQTERSGELVATMTALVVEVMPNGNLVVEGRRMVRVNNEEEELVLRGVIRPRDVSAQNTIPSSLIADAKIYFSGRGVLADKQKPGWLSRGLDKGSPF